MVFEYIDGGSDDQRTLRRNASAFDDVELHYRVLAGNEHADLDLSTTIFGQPTALPFFGSPTAGNRMFHAEGERGVAAAAAAHGAAYALSAFSTTTFEDVVTVNTSPAKTFQLYVWRDRAFVRDVLARAKAAGFTSLALTCDMAWFGNRERETRSGFSLPPKYDVRQFVDALRAPEWTFDFLSHPPYTYALIDHSTPAGSIGAFMNAQINPAFDWDDAAWLVREWGGPTALKGVVTPEDAARAVEVGFSTVWVSNHGGRQLETAPATIDVLPSIRAAVGSDVELIFDGGVTRGTHIAKALGLGADSVALGKPILFGLAAGGEYGVRKAYTILRTELERCMGLMGVASIAELKARGPALMRPRRGIDWQCLAPRTALER